MSFREATTEAPRGADEAARKEDAAMERQEACPYRAVHDVQWSALREDLAELKGRVQRLETTLGRGVFLLVANMVGIIASLLHQLAK